MILLEHTELRVLLYNTDIYIYIYMVENRDRSLFMLAWLLGWSQLLVRNLGVCARAVVVQVGGLSFCSIEHGVYSCGSARNRNKKYE